MTPTNGALPLRLVLTVVSLPLLLLLLLLPSEAAAAASSSTSYPPATAAAFAFRSGDGTATTRRQGASGPPTVQQRWRPHSNDAERRPNGLLSTTSSSTSSSSSSPPSTLTAAELVSSSTGGRGSVTGSGPLSWNSLRGQADRSFRLGIQLERNGQFRKASSVLHEAATLYQCYLDSESEFAHVTALASRDDCEAILAYASIRLGFLNHDALGDSRAAVRLYKEASRIDPTPSAVSHDGMGESLEAAYGGEQLYEAVESYRNALKLSPNNKKVMFHLAVALERLGGEDDGNLHEANEIFEKLRRDEACWACLVDSWGYVRWHTRKAPKYELNLYGGTRDMLQLALKAAMPLIEEGGLVCEFGVGGGRSMRMTQEILPLDVSIHGFDTFTGLPQAWGTEPAGAYSTGGVVPNIDGKVFFHKGLFGDTIRPFLEEAGDGAYLAYANIDCDLYSSTLDILESLVERRAVVAGTILVFDEYIGHPTWRQDEFRAWRECCKRFGWKYEYLAFSLGTKQAVVRVIDA